MQIILWKWEWSSTEETSRYLKINGDFKYESFLGVDVFYINYKQVQKYS